jgi:hypothetical protein
MTAALPLPLTSPGNSAVVGCVMRLVVLLRFCDDDGQVNRLLPVWRAAAANPRMGSGHRTSEDGGEACGSKCKAVVPCHGPILPRQNKNAMRKKELAKLYAMRKNIPAMTAIPTRKIHSYNGPNNTPTSWFLKGEPVRVPIIGYVANVGEKYAVAQVIEWGGEKYALREGPGKPTPLSEWMRDGREYRTAGEHRALFV